MIQQTTDCNPLFRDPLGPWLALFHTPKLSLKKTHALLKAFGSPQQLFQQPADVLSSLNLQFEARNYLESMSSAIPADTQQKIAQDNQWAEKPDNHIIAFDDERYPPLLKEISDPPLILFVKGDPAALLRPQIAIVGSRKASVSGLKTAQRLASELASAGVTMTSGLALGVDGAAHQGALDVNGPTVGVMATGADRLYPRRHIGLAKQIIENGALVTELPLGTAPLPAFFPQRNRIISGLSLGVMVVEAAPRSGSLITARYALEQNREVFAVPGSINNPMAKGCHGLLRQGAKLVECAEDVLEEFSDIVLPATDASVQKKVTAAPHLSEQQAQVLENIGFEATSLDTLMARCDMSPPELIQILTALELVSCVKSVPGGFIRNT